MKKIVNPWTGIKDYFCFGCSPENEAGVKMEFYEDGEDIVSIWHPKPQYQRWKDTLHGGIQAVLLDEICAWAVLYRLNTTGVTSKMETRYRRPVSTCDRYLKLEAHVVAVRRNLVTIEATLFNSAGECCTQAVCTYFVFSEEKTAEMGYCGLELEPEEMDEAAVIKDLMGAAD